VLAAATAAAVAVLGSATASHADDQQVLRGAGFPDDSAFLTYVACDGFFGAASPPQLRINLGPDVAPLGRRSMGFVPAAPGSGAGPYTRLDSLATGSARLSVAAEEGTTGVSYAWYSAPDAPSGKAWSGRADVPVAAGGWRQVDAGTLSYRWTLVDLASRQPVRDGGSASLAGFTAQHGDGPGYVVTGFGCDGQDFNIDAVQAGTPGDVSTFDFEGLQVSTSIGASRQAVRPGRPTVLTGTVTDTAGRVLGDPLVLEARPPGGVWSVVADLVLAEADGVVRHEVAPDATMEYRWVLPESQYADAGVSLGLLVTVGP
jgi:hypothetical protein